MPDQPKDWVCPDCGEKYCSCDEECTCDIGPIDECPIHYPIDDGMDAEDVE